MDTLNTPQSPTSFEKSDDSVQEKWKRFCIRFKVKSPIMLIISGLILCVIIYFIIDRIQFLGVVERVDGSITNITAYNSRCGGKNKHACTEFTAYVDFTTRAGQKSSFTVSGGNSYGHNQPVTDSYRKIGDTVKVAYDSSKITRVYEDSFFGIWGTPIYAFIFQISTFFGAFSEKRKKNNN